MNATITLNKLIQWDGNVRKTNAADGVDELAASIAAHGLLNPLTVQAGKKGTFTVVAGQRRLLALQSLAKAGTISTDAPVECNVLADGVDPTEASLAENVVRTAMHPADQFEAWRDLADNGLSSAEIAIRFGVTTATVEKRLKLGRVSPALLDIFRQGGMGLEEVEAFTVTDDQAQQELVWAGLTGWRRNARGIREALTEGEVPATDKKVRLIGLDAYQAAGGAVRRDLFDDRNAGWVSDTVLLDRLVAEKLEAVAAEVRSEGWKWVEVRPSFERYTSAYHREFASMERGKPTAMTAEEKSELDALQAELEPLDEIDSYDSDEELTDEEARRKEEIEARIKQMQDRPHVYSKTILKRCGAIVTLDYEGLEVVRGLTLKADVPKADEKPANDVPAKSAYSQSLLESLTKEVTGVMQAEMAADPRLALVALLHSICTLSGSPLHISFSPRSCVSGSLAESVVETAATTAAVEMPDAYDSRAVWDWLEGQETYRLLEILAVHLAQTVDARERHTGVVRTAQKLDLRKWFTPDAENYFGKVSKDQVLADLAEMEVPVADLKAFGSMKKGELAKAAAKIAADTDWLPHPMRLVPEARSEEDDELEEAA